MENVQIINLTPHSINIKGYGEISPSGIIPRVKQIEKAQGPINGIPVFEMSFEKEVKDMPPSQPRTIYIVSALLAQALRGRDDIFVPAHPIRNEKGQIIGCEALARIR